MSVRLSPEGNIVLEGACTLEDAEKLQQRLLENPDAKVDWQNCVGAHTAVIQVLLAARPEMQGRPAGTLLRDFVDPLLRTVG